MSDQYSRDRYLTREGRRSEPVSKQNFEQTRRAHFVNPKVFMALAAVAVVLLAVIVIRFIAFGGTASEYGKIQNELNQERTQLTELQASNDELQSKMDSMQGLIDEYNSRK